VLASAGNYLTLYAVHKMVLRLRMDVLRQLDRLCADYYENTAPGAVMYSLNEPIEEVAYFGSDLLPAILRLVLTTTFTIVTMSVLSPICRSLAMICFLARGMGGCNSGTVWIKRRALRTTSAPGLC
jgi:ABC-type transport system involved in cytochrome bd biosynthesis fused ATPase/permease subunit